MNGVQEPMEIAPLPDDLVQFPEPVFGFLVEVDRFLEVRKTRDTFNVSGEGLAVAVLDTGLRVDHVDFAGKVLAQRNFTEAYDSDPDNAADDDGHGTHVGSIIVSGGAGAIHKGIAPGAGIIPLKVLPGDFAMVAEALQWVIDNQSNHQITVVNMSLSDEGNYFDDTDYAQHPVRKAIKTLRAMRVPVVVSAGNLYLQHESQQGMGFPAILRECVSVGAVYDDDVGGMSYFSGTVIALSLIHI